MKDKAMISALPFSPASSPLTSKLAINRSLAIVEARRCLQCFDAPCTQACPVHIDIPGFVGRLAQENMSGSYELLVGPNPLATTCGLVCPTMDLCEGACVLPGLGQNPIRIGALQFFVARNLRKSEQAGQVRSPKRVAIIGGGPSGLSCATALRRIGHRVSIFESADSIGGLMDRVIPPHRLPHEVVEHDLDRLDALGIEVHLKCRVDGETAGEIQEEYDAIFVAAGLARTRALAVPGVDFDGVGPALDYLRQSRASDWDSTASARTGSTVVVVGGGNVALDAATVSKRRGAERVIVLYRRTMDEMPGWKTEYMEAAGLGVEFRWLSTVSRILGQAGLVCGVEVQPMQLSKVQQDGRRGVDPHTDGPRYQIPCDMVLLALGQEIDTELTQALSLSTTPGGLIAVAPGTFRASQSKVFAGGDAVSGDGTIVHAVAQGMAAAREIHAWLAEPGGVK